MPPETIIKAIIALLPVTILVLVLYRIDSHRLLSTHFMVKVFLSGGAVAVSCYFLNAWLMQFLTWDFSLFTRYAAPFIEEGLKAGIVVYLFRTNRIGFLIDAGIIGFTVGAGFAFVENLYYLHTQHDAHYGVWLVRGLGTAIMHGGATALFALTQPTASCRYCAVDSLNSSSNTNRGMLLLL